MHSRVRSKRSSEIREEQGRASARAIEEFAAAEEKWAKMTVSSKQEVENIRDYAVYLTEEIAQLVATQPTCCSLGENYDDVFSEYKAKAEKVRSSNRRLLKIVDDRAYATARLRSVQDEIETLRKLDAKNREFWDEWQKNYAINILGQLESLSLGFALLGNVKLEGQEELRKEFEKNSSILERLVQSTHKWTPIEEQSITIRPAWNPPEGSSMEPRQAEVRKFVSKSKCEKCSKQRTGSF